MRKRLAAAGAQYIAAPVSGNATGDPRRASSPRWLRGPRPPSASVEPLIKAFAPGGVSYVGEGELARVCKIAHNVMLGVVIENLIEITLLCNKMGVPRHAFLAFLNNSAMGSMFTRYKSPALVNLDWTTTFTPELLRKDIDLGLELGREQEVPMPVTAAAREVLQSHFGAATPAARPGEVPGRRLRRARRDHGAGRRHEAREREQARADGTGVTPARMVVIPGLVPDPARSRCIRAKSSRIPRCRACRWLDPGHKARDDSGAGLLCRQNANARLDFGPIAGACAAQVVVRLQI